MRRWRVTWTRAAEGYYRRLGSEHQGRFQEAVAALETDPFASKNVKRLHGELKGLYRYRVGGFRMVFRVLEEGKEIRILAIASRGDIYR